MTGGELRLTECKSDEAIRFNAGVCWDSVYAGKLHHGVIALSDANRIFTGTLLPYIHLDCVDCRRIGVD